jgi:hypothetical protein
MPPNKGNVAVFPALIETTTADIEDRLIDTI